MINDPYDQYNDLEYEYNADGLLVGKTELEYPYYHQYYYEGDRMIAEVWESEGLFFLYDSTVEAMGVASFSEASAKGTGLYIPAGHTLLDRMIVKA